MGKWQGYGRRHSKNLRLVVAKNVHPQVRACCRKFVKWMRKQDGFPVRLTIYLRNQAMITAMDGDKCYSTYFQPDSPRESPNIRVAAKCRWTRDVDQNDNALAGILDSIAHEIGLYYFWLDHPEATEAEDDAADSYAEGFSDEMLDRYAQIHKHLYAPR